MIKFFNNVLCPHCGKKHNLEIYILYDTFLITDQNIVQFDKKITKFQRWMLKRIFKDGLK
jgi:hypothetical protein